MSSTCESSSSYSISQDACKLKGACQSSNENLRFGELSEASLHKSGSSSDVKSSVE